MSVDACERCGNSKREVHWSVAHGRWLCLECHMLPAPFDRLVFLAVGDEPTPLAVICKRLERDPKDRAVRRMLAQLAREGRLSRREYGMWVGPSDDRALTPRATPVGGS